MITNLIASIVVTFSTNVHERFPGHNDLINLPCPEGIIGCLVFHGHYEWIPERDPQKKWVRTTVKKLRGLDVHFEGEAYMIKLSEEVVSDVEQEFHLERVDKWIAGEKRPQFNFGSVTNWSATNASIVMFTNQLTMAISNSAIYSFTNRSEVLTITNDFKGNGR